MPKTTAPFNAARLVDERCQVELALYKVDPSTHESLLESVEAIRLSKRKPDEIAGMLAVVQAKASDMFSDEERATLFKDVPESDGTPHEIKIEAETYPLIYEALDQLSLETAESETSDELEALKAQITELETKVSECETQISERDSRIAELTATEEPGAKAQIEILTKQLEVLGEQVAEKDSVISSRDETITALRSEMAGFLALKHESLVKDVAQLTTELGMGISVGKTFDELCDLLSVRTDESLNDMISDLKLEKEARRESEQEESVEQIEDPTTQSQPELDPKNDPEGTQEALYQSITTDEKEVEVYRVGGHLTEEELAECFGTKEE